MSIIQRGRHLEKQDKVPDFVKELTDDLEQYWNETYAKIISTIQKLKVLMLPRLRNYSIIPFTYATHSFIGGKESLERVRETKEGRA